MGDNSENNFFSTETATVNMLDNEPIIFLGCSQGEFFSILVFSFIFWVITLLIIFLTFIDALLIAIVIPFVLSILLVIPTCFIACKHVEKSKRGRPDGYYSLQVKLLIDTLMSLLGAKRKFCKFTGNWSKSRSV